MFGVGMRSELGEQYLSRHLEGCYLTVERIPRLWTLGVAGLWSSSKVIFGLRRLRLFRAASGEEEALHVAVVQARSRSLLSIPSLCPLMVAMWLRCAISFTMQGERESAPMTQILQPQDC